MKIKELFEGMNLAAFSGGTQIQGSDNVFSPVGSISAINTKKAEKNAVKKLHKSNRINNERLPSSNI